MKTNETEISKVIKYVKEIQPKVIVQIGVGDGLLLARWTKELNPDITVGIDNNLKHVDLEATKDIILQHGDSHDIGMPERTKIFLHDRPIDFLILTGDHTYEGTKKDFDLWSPLVRKGGIIAVNYTKLNHPKYSLQGIEAWRYWNELIGKTNVKYLEFWDQYGNPVGPGIGLFYNNV